MNTAIWLLAGAAIGWVAYVYLKANKERGMAISVIIGVLGAAVGGKMLAPVFGTAVAPGDFSPFALLVASATAAACLIIGNLVSRRYGV
jgi:uncharacterized membrane protein YeaQ/YmgE (transglycosylase-associated protein family)